MSPAAFPLNFHQKNGKMTFENWLVVKHADDCERVELLREKIAAEIYGCLPKKSKISIINRSLRP